MTTIDVQPEVYASIVFLIQATTMAVRRGCNEKYPRQSESDRSPAQECQRFGNRRHECLFASERGIRIRMATREIEKR